MAFRVSNCTQDAIREPRNRLTITVGRKVYSRNDKAASQRSSTLSARRSSARVRPRLTAAIGMPRRAAIWAKRKPESTISDEHGVGLFEGRLGCGDLISRNALAEENDVRLLDAAARSAGRHGEPGEVEMIEIGIAVGQRRAVEIDPGGVEADQFVLEVGAPAGGRAGRAADEIKAPV
jgi:hypothetical protein